MSARPWDQGVLDVVHTDWRPSRRDARESIRQAITLCAERNGGRVHIAWFRDDLPEWVAPPSIGAAISSWTSQGYLRDTNEWIPMGGHAGNAGKPARVRVLVRPIPSELKEAAA